MTQQFLICASMYLATLPDLGTMPTFTKPRPC